MSYLPKLEDKRVILFFAPPGRRRKFTALIDSMLSEPKSVFVIDFDSVLMESLGVYTIFDLTNNFTRDYIQDSWKRTLKTLAHTISSLQFQNYIVICHVLYYKIFTREYFPIFNARSFSDENITEKKLPKVSKVALIIDDIYDTFSDLHHEKELFSDATFLDDYAPTRKLSVDQIMQSPNINFDWLNYCMASILEWRSQEIILAQDVAAQLSSEFLLWGIKQDPHALLRWALNEKEQMFYVSHPISEARESFAEMKTWPTFVDVINRIQIELMKYNIPSVMPTAIDELRFQKNETNHTGLLTARWPLPQSVESILKKFSLIETDIEKSNLFAPSKIKIVGQNIERESISIADVQQYANGALNTLEMEIQEQMANRDHLLVWSSSGVIVVEPWSMTDHRVHGGMRKEMKYICDTNDAKGLKPMRRICTVLSSEAVKDVIHESNYKTRYVRNIRKIISLTRAVGDVDTEILINDNAELNERVGSMGPYVPSNVVSEIRTHISDIRKQASVNAFIEKALMIGESALAFTDLIFVDSLEQILNESYIHLIHGFLTGGPPDLKYQNEIASIAKSTGLLVN